MPYNINLPCTCHWEELLSAKVFWVKSVEEIFEADQRFSINHPSCNGCYFIALHTLHLYKHGQNLSCDNYNQWSAEESKQSQITSFHHIFRKQNDNCKKDNKLTELDLLLQQHEWEHPPRLQRSADLKRLWPMVELVSVSSDHHMQT